MDKILVTTVGLGIIGFIYWFFFGKTEVVTAAENSITVIVDGGYKPKAISIPGNKKTSIIFLRKDANSCLEDLIIPDFKVKKYLPMHTPVTVVLSPGRPGTYDFHCGMNMFHGKIKVT